MAPLYTTKNDKKLDGKLVVITGANTGIGKETALDLSRRGARVLILCRNVEKGNAAAEEIAGQTGGVVEVGQLNLASLKSVRECAERILEKEEKIDLLINNAGVMMCPYEKTEDDFEMQFGTNHLGHFLLTELLLPLVKKSKEAGNKPRIVIVSSVAHAMGGMNWDDLQWEKSYNDWKAYCQSKLSNVLHAKALARKLGEDSGIVVASLHPGAINTELQRHVSDHWWAKLALPLARWFFLTPTQGAQTTLYAALDDKLDELPNGSYFADCKEKAPQRDALNEEFQDKLWELSEKFVGLKPNI